MNSHQHNAEPTLLLGTGPLTWALLKEIQARPECGYRIVGIVTEKEEGGPSFHDRSVLGTIEELPQIMARLKPRRVVVTLLHKDAHMPIHQLMEAKYCGNVLVEAGERVYERITGKVAIEALTPGGVVFSGDYQPSSARQAWGRAMSMGFALAGLALLAPVMALVALAIKLDSRGPVLFVQERVGLGCRRFKLLKFRTMHPSEKRVSEWAGDNQHRVTRVGKVLRKFRLDELPQFFNVIRGDMNIVGPRPHPASNYELFTLVSRNTPECGGQIPYYSLRSMVRPGITGWAQVRYQYANNLNEEIEKLRFDLYYVKHYSPWLDIRILWETIAVVALGHESKRVDEEETAAPEPARQETEVATPLRPSHVVPPGAYSGTRRSAHHGNL